MQQPPMKKCGFKGVNTMKYIYAFIFGLVFCATAIAQNQNVVADTNGVVVRPTNFWSVDASNARTKLGLGSSATNPSSAFQPSSSALTNLSSNNAVNLTNFTASSLPTVGLASNVTGIVSITNGGTGTNTAAAARTNLSLGWSALTNTDSTNFRTAIGLASYVTNPTVQITNGGTGATNATSARQNLGSTSVGDAVFIATNASAARVSLGATTVGEAVFTLINPSDTRFLRFNANNTVSALTDSEMRSALSVGTNLGTVTSIGMSVPSFLSLSTSTITSSGTFAITLANQTSRYALIAPNGGGIPAFRALDSDDLPSLAISKITGLQTALDGKLATNGNGGSITNLTASSITGTVALASNVTGTVALASNITGIAALASNVTGTVALASNVTGTIAISNGGTGATNAANARTNLGLGLSALTNTTTSDFLIALGISTTSTNSIIPVASGGTGATNAATARTNLGLGWSALTNTDATNFRTAISLASYVTNPIVPLTNGGTGATNAATARTNFGLGATWLTNTNVTNFQSDIGFSFIKPDTTSFEIIPSPAENPTWDQASGFKWKHAAFMGPGSNYYAFYPIYWPSSGQNYGIRLVYSTNPNTLETKFYIDAFDGHIEAGGTSTFDQLEGGINIPTNKSITFSNALAADTTRTNLGLGWSALTNSNAGIGLVSVNTNGSVVSPTNFWQVAPISTTVQYFTNIVVNSTNSATNSRNLFVHSMAVSVSGVTNTINLPTNSSTFNGDIATIIHKGTTTTTTIVKNTGSTNTLIAISNYNETVNFMFEQGAWSFAENPSFVAPVFFSGTNASVNAAQSRTNLGLGLTALTNTNTTNFQSAVFQTNTTPSGTSYASLVAWMEVNVITNGVTTSFRIPLFK